MSKLLCRPLVMLAFWWAGSASAIPITGAGIVSVDSAEWAQIDLFKNLSWSDINAVCPNGNCGTGTLNGYDMGGWAWASLEEMNALFNHYLTDAGISGSELLGPGPDAFEEFEAPFGPSWFSAFREDGWNYSGATSLYELYAGWTSTDQALAQLYAQGRYPYGVSAEFSTDILNLDNSTSTRGAWFYRTGIPIPATIHLLGLGLAALRFSRRRGTLNS